MKHLVKIIDLRVWQLENTDGKWEPILKKTLKKKQRKKIAKPENALDGNREEMLDVEKE